MRKTVDVDIIGAINDYKLKAHVTGHIDDASGSGELEFAYTEIPPAPDWHPLNYTDPLVLLPAYPGARGGMKGIYPTGSFRADVSLDFDNGLRLRKGATIIVTPGGIHTGGYYMTGTARSGDVPNVLGMKHGKNLHYEYREFMHPAGAGQVIGIGYAHWPSTGKASSRPIEAVVSSRYRFSDKVDLPGHFVRVIEIPDATWDPARKVVKALFNTRLEVL